MRFRFMTCLVLSLAVRSSLCAQVTAAGVVNAADYSGDLAPGSLISVFGTGFSAGMQAASGVPLPASLGGTSVQIGNGSISMTLPLYFVSPGQINAQLPYDIQGAYTLTVTSGASTTAPVPLKVVPSAPKFFTLSEDGSGFIAATHADYSLVSKTSPARSGETLILFMNSMGAVNPPVQAGQAPAATGNSLLAQPVVTLDTMAAKVNYAGLAPGFPGLYQVNFVTPFDDKLGAAPISVAVGSGSTQPDISVPLQANGLYFVVSGGRFPNGQTLNGAAGSSTAILYRHNNNPTFPASDANTWSRNTGLPGSFSTSSGIALTLENSGAVVYDNNGLENGTYGGYYGTSPGNNVLFSMSRLASPTPPANTVQLTYAGYFKTAAPTVFNQIIGYFEGPENVNPSFDPANIYNGFRMNLYSNTGGAPGANSFTGDVFSSDSGAGKFSFSRTGVNRVTSNGAAIPIYRLVYTLNAPMSLPAGDYWFSHDVATPAPGEAAAGQEFEPAGPSMRALRPAVMVKE